MRDWLAVLLGILAVIVFIVFPVYMHFSAPCDWYKWGVAGDVPARCVMK